MAGHAVRERRKVAKESMDDESIEKYLSTTKVKSGIPKCVFF